MKLLSKDLVSLEYRDQLRQDLARATVCRFLIAYVSLDGLDAIGRHLLNRALRDPRSFGVASLSCSCGYEPLLKLQRDLPDLRLKYFMDPKVNEPDEPCELALFHSKLLYLLMEREQKAVIYIGSHNWSRRALAPGGPRNAEASMRFEVEIGPGDLDGTNASLAGETNRHLLDAWNFPWCFPAIDANRVTFEEWYSKGCRRAISSPLQETTIVLAVRKAVGAMPAPSQWLLLEGRGIYMQALEESDGQAVHRSGDRLLVLVWESQAALQSSRQPILLQCRVTTFNAGPDSELRGRNQADAPIEGFEAVIFDETKLNARKAGRDATRPTIRLTFGGEVGVYDFEFPTSRTDSQQVDGGVQPKYQFLLVVEKIICPADGQWPDDVRLLWRTESFAVADSRDSAKYQDKPGFYVEPQLREEMMKVLEHVLHIHPEQAKVLPFSEKLDLKIGKRVSGHPLHDTFIGTDAKEGRDVFYSKAYPGALVADIDASAEAQRELAAEWNDGQPLPRVQKVFTMPFADLFEIWESAAQQAHPDKHHPPR